MLRMLITGSDSNFCNGLRSIAKKETCIFHPQPVNKSEEGSSKKLFKTFLQFELIEQS